MNDTPLDIRPQPGDAIGFRAPQGVQAPARSGLRGVIMLLLLLLLVGAVAWIIYNRSTSAPSSRRLSTGPIPVGVATVGKGDLPVELSGLGTVTPLATVTVQTQIAGQMQTIGFKEGQIVQKGDFLAQIDPRPYQVALDQAIAQLGKDEASLNEARVDLKRYNTLVSQNSIATQTRDTQAALVLQDEATVKADQALINTQKLNLVYCHIVSPVTGRVGLRQVDPGNYVTPTSQPNGLVVVTQLQPISVIFTLPEDDLPQVMKQLHAGLTLTAAAYDRTGATKLADGKLETVDNQIDTTTGTVRLRAIFDNPEDQLFPNQFVNVRLLVDTVRGAEIIPEAAVQRGAPGTFVYVVGADHKASVATVKLGPSSDQRVVVESGVTDGQQVVVDGADRLKDGAAVSIAPPPGAAAAGAPNAATPQKGHRQRPSKPGGT